MTHDFSRMDYDPTVEGILTEVYPELSAYPAFLEPVGNSVVKSLEGVDKILRFVIIFFSNKSPLFKVKDFDERKRLALILCKATDEAKTSIAIKDDTFRAVSLQYLKIESNYLFEEWYSKKELYHSWLEILRTPPDMLDSQLIGKQAGINKDSGPLRAELESLEAQLFSDKQVAKLISSFEDQKRITGPAEQYARKFNASDNIF